MQRICPVLGTLLRLILTADLVAGALSVSFSLPGVNGGP